MKTVLLLLLLFPAGLRAQEQPAAGEAPVQSVAIRSAKRSFFPGYPVDSLVQQLNRLNRNPSVRFYRSTDDDSPTGFYADFVIDVDFDVHYAHLEAPPPAEARLSFLQLAPTRGNAGNSPQNLPDRRADFRMKTGEGVCTVKILERRKNEKITKEYLRASSDDDEALQFKLTSGALNYLLYRFKKQ